MSGQNTNTSELTKLSEENNSLKGQIANLQNEIARLKKELEKGSESDKLAQENRDLRRQLSDLQTENAKLQKEISFSREKKPDSQPSVEDSQLSADSQALTDSKADKKDQFDKIEKLYKDAKQYQTIGAIKTAINQIYKECNILAKEPASLQEKVPRHLKKEDRLSQLEILYQEAVNCNERREIKSILGKIYEQCHNLQQEFLSLKKQSKKGFNGGSYQRQAYQNRDYSTAQEEEYLLGEMADLSKKLEIASQKISDLEQNNRMLSRANDELSAMIMGLKDKIDNIIGERQARDPEEIMQDFMDKFVRNKPVFQAPEKVLDPQGQKVRSEKSRAIEEGDQSDEPVHYSEGNQEGVITEQLLERVKGMLPEDLVRFFRERRMTKGQILPVLEAAGLYLPKERVKQEEDSTSESEEMEEDWDKIGEARRAASASAVPQAQATSGEATPALIREAQATSAKQESSSAQTTSAEPVKGFQNVSDGVFVSKSKRTQHSSGTPQQASGAPQSVKAGAQNIEQQPSPTAQQPSPTAQQPKKYILPHKRVLEK